MEKVSAAVLSLFMAIGFAFGDAQTPALLHKMAEGI
jgi:hypothetical protein